MRLIESISEDLALSVQYIQRLSNSADHHYKTYSIRKRKRGRRKIDHPSQELKLLQRWLCDKLFRRIPVSDKVFSYRTGISIKDNASVHKKNEYLLKIDFCNFFPSITAIDIIKLLKDNEKRLPYDLSSNDRKFITSIVCRSGCLTIGAPSSPIISNAILYRFDKAIEVACKKHGVLYTRYADDLFFSTKTPGHLKIIYEEVRKALVSMPYPKLTINDKKTVFTSRKHLRLVTGVVLTSDNRLSVGRGKKREIRSMVYLFSRNELDDKKVSYLRGCVSYIAHIEPRFIASLEAKFGKEVMLRLSKASLINLKPKRRSAPGFKA